MRARRGAVGPDGGSGAGRLAAPLLVCLALSACGPNADPAGTPIAWWHDLQGGAIAEHRPPPPGVDAPYPHVGTTPARPSIPSVAARDALTASLLEQRQTSHHMDAHDPIEPVPTATPTGQNPTTATASTATAGQTRSSATIGDAPPATPDAAAPAQGTQAAATATAKPATPAQPPVPPKKPAPLLTPEQQEAAEPKLTMPPIPTEAGVTVAGNLPQMPASPPGVPHFPGFDIPDTPLRKLRPAIVAAAPAPAQAGAPVAFAPASDVLLKSGRDALRHAALSRNGAAIRITGYGDAAAETPADQEAALHLALARAASAAGELVALGVPQSSITLAALAFGRGGEVSVLH